MQAASPSQYPANTDSGERSLLFVQVFVPKAELGFGMSASIR
jgi:hypothetical protein